MPKELALSNRIKKWVQDRGGLAFKYQATGQNHAGFPDLILILHGGKVIFCETKAPGKTPSPIQTATISEINVAGGRAFWCDSLEGFLSEISHLCHLK